MGWVVGDQFICSMQEGASRFLNSENISCHIYYIKIAFFAPFCLILPLKSLEYSNRTVSVLASNHGNLRAKSTQAKKFETIIPVSL